jgi:hypothetical protein
MSKFDVEAYAVVFANGNFSLRASLQAAEHCYTMESHMAAREGTKTSPPIAIVRLGTAEVVAIAEEELDSLNEEEEDDQICPDCRGSGLGQRPDTICTKCGSKGIIIDSDGYDND